MPALDRLRQARREPLFGALPRALGWGQDAIERLLPHRSPLLLLDRIVATDANGSRAIGTRRLDPADPVFLGHFPGDPVYPGALLLEMGGQLGLCLGDGLSGDAPPDRARPVRLIRVHGAEFVDAARPGDELTVLAEVVEDDGWTLRILTQVLKAGTEAGPTNPAGLPVAAGVPPAIVCAAELEAMWGDA